jgi:glycosyltransferase involved in cell wall biosynthesis
MYTKKAMIFSHLYNDCSGSPRVLRDMLEVVSKRLNNTERYLITSQHEGFLSSSPVNNELIVHYGRSSNKLVQLFLFIINQLHTFFVTVSLIRKLKKQGVDVTLVVNTMLPFGSALAAKILKARCIYYIQESSVKPKIFKSFLRSVINLCADEIVYVSRYLQSVESFSKIESCVLYNGLREDFSSFIDVPKKMKYSNKNILFAGSLKDYKGIFQYITLAKALPSYNFIAALNCEPHELNLFLKEQNLPKNCDFYSRPPNLQQLFLDSTFVVNMSLPELWTETFGLSLLEGLASGSPVIAPPIGGHTEFVNEENGFLIDSRATEELVKCITQTSKSYETWEAYSQQALKTASNFSYEEFSGNIYRFFSYRGFS